MPLQTIQLEDPSSAARAGVVPQLGFNCFSWQVLWQGKHRDLIWSDPAFLNGTERPTGSGIPVLFPFPGRIAGTDVVWEGTTYRLEAGDGQGNAIHGFVFDRPWRAEKLGPNEVAGTFQASVDGPELLKAWPADFRITVTYRVSANTLVMETRIENPDDKTLPWGLGIHPYFALPLTGDDADQCMVRLPVQRQWELANLVPTGRQLPVEEADSLQQGVPFASLSLDNVFTELIFQNDQCCAKIEDPAGGAKLTIQFDRAFRECVVYTPPHRQAICIEPYTCVPNPFALKERGLDTGLRQLAPGESASAVMTLTFEATD